MAIKVGINSFGRIGRGVLRAGVDNSNIDFDITDGGILNKDVVATLDGKKVLGPTIQLEERRKKEEEIYGKYCAKLERHHKGEFVAISFDTEEIIKGKDEVWIGKEAIKKFGSGKYLFKRIGYPYVHRI